MKWQLTSVIQSDDGPTSERTSFSTYEEALDKAVEIKENGGAWIAIAPIKDSNGNYPDVVTQDGEDNERGKN